MTEKEQKFLADLKHTDANVRMAAWRQADQMDAAVVPELATLLTAEEPGVRKAAGEALERLVHSVGKSVGGQKRGAIVKELLGLLTEKRPAAARIEALRMLSLIGGAEVVPSVAPLLAEPPLREEAAFCLERIPEAAAIEALLAGLKQAPDDFKPRLLAALGHRRAEAATEACAAAMGSANLEVAMAAMKALARIGVKPKAEPQLPNMLAMSDWQRIEFADSLLRYADAQLQRKNYEDSLRIYRLLLTQREEHLQCAALISLSKAGVPEAAAAIYPRLSSENNTVRITAEKAWAAMQKAAQPKA